VLYAVVGSLVNLTTDPLHRDALVAAGGCQGLLDVLERCVAAIHAAVTSETRGDGGEGGGGGGLSLGTICALAVIVCKAMVNITVVGIGAVGGGEEVEAACDMLGAVTGVTEGGLAGVAEELMGILKGVEVKGRDGTHDGETHLEPL
jgi:hypothetical protein